MPTITSQTLKSSPASTDEFIINDVAGGNVDKKVTLGGMLTGQTLVNPVLTNPTMTTPTLGVASATTVNKVAITAPATGSTLTIADGKTVVVNNSLTLAGTDGTTMTFPATSATLARTDAANTFTGVQTMTSPVLTTPTLTSPTATGAVIRQEVTSYNADGALGTSSGIAVITKGSAAAMSITPPSSQDGTRITIISNSAFAHVITFSGGTLWDGTTGVNTTVTMAAFPGSSLTIIAVGTVWLLESQNNLTSIA